MMRPLVLPDDDGLRPAGAPDKCFYCDRQIGQEHARDCVTLQKRVRVRVEVEYEIVVPFAWDAGKIERHRSGLSSWCADSIKGELEEATKKGCLCNNATTEVLEMSDQCLRLMRDTGELVEVESPRDPDAGALS